MKYILLMVLFSGCVSQEKPDCDNGPTPPSSTSVGVVFLNGTGARCSMYRSSTRHFKSEGYEVSCPESSNTGSGEDCLNAIEGMKAKSIGIIGHSQGGGGAFMCAARAEKKFPGKTFAVIGVQPAHGMRAISWEKYYKEMKSPSFQFWGTRDTLVSKDWVYRGYNKLTAEKYILSAVGAPHVIPTDWIKESSVFFDWKVKGDSSAKDKFLNLANTRRWD
jgi:dienelactone hydrolase